MPSASESHAALAGTLKERYDDVRKRIDAASKRSIRRGGEVILVAVTKHASIDQIRELIGLGHVDFGENRVQSLIQRHAQVEEFLQRRSELGRGRGGAVPKQVRWHMIGTLQRNKVRKVLPLVRLIHSLDSLRLAEEIQAAATRREEPVELLIQVNTSGERSKHGVAPAAVRHLIDQIDTMMNMRVRGLMCMAPESEDPTEARPYFQLARELFEDIRRIGVGGERFDILSMGMSGDFEVAIECGANVVRVGTAVGPPTEEVVEED
jgi:pyridoxal phosphate enzyme (YggS family)